MVQKDTCTSMFFAGLFTMPRHGSNRNVHPQRNGLRRCGTYIQWNITHKKNEIMPFAATWMDLEREHHTE